MSWFSKRSKNLRASVPETKDQYRFELDDVKEDYFYLETLPEDMSQELWAKIATIMDFFRDQQLSPATIDGGFDYDETARFMRYRDKEKLFLPQTSYHNFYSELHRRGGGEHPRATFGNGFLKELSPKEALNSRVTRYVDGNGQTAIKIERNDKDQVLSVSYFRDGKLKREDSYDQQGRLMMSERYAEVPNLQRLSSTDPLFVTTRVQKMVLDMSGRPVMVALPTFNQFWIESESGEPVKSLDDEMSLLVWWLTQNFKMSKRKLYVDATSDLFERLIDEPEMHTHVVPIVYDQPNVKRLAQFKATEYLVSKQFANQQDVQKLPGQVLPIPSWYEYMPQ